MQKLKFDKKPLTEVLSPESLSGDGSLVEQVYTLLRARIVDLSLPPEKALVEKEVASILRVSKTPVREAIIRLTREGLVRVIPKSGSYVTQVDVDRYLQACFVRVQLEVGCVRRLAAKGVPMAKHVELKGLLAEQRQAFESGEERRFFELDEAFHKLFFVLAGLPGVWDTLNAAKGEMDRVRHLKREFGIRHGRSVLEEHRFLVEAILQGDPDLAERAMLNHIGGVDEEIGVISEHPQLLRTIDDINTLVALDRKSRGRRKSA